MLDHSSWQGLISLWIFYALIGKSVLPFFQGHHAIVSRLHSIRSNCIPRSRSYSSYGFTSLSIKSSSRLPSLTAPGARNQGPVHFPRHGPHVRSMLAPLFHCFPHKNSLLLHLFTLCPPKYGLNLLLCLLSVTLILLTIPGVEGDPQVPGCPGIELLVLSLQMPRIDAMVLRLLNTGVNA